MSAPILGNTLYTTEEGKAATCLTLCDTYWQKFYFIFMLIVFFFIPLLVLIILYLRIARNLVPAQSNDGDEQVIFLPFSKNNWFTLCTISYWASIFILSFTTVFFVWETWSTNELVRIGSQSSIIHYSFSFVSYPKLSVGSMYIHHMDVYKALLV